MSSYFSVSFTSKVKIEILSDVFYKLWDSGSIEPEGEGRYILTVSELDLSEGLSIITSFARTFQLTLHIEHGSLNHGSLSRHVIPSHADWQNLEDGDPAAETPDHTPIAPGCTHYVRYQRHTQYQWVGCCESANIWNYLTESWEPTAYPVSELEKDLSTGTLVKTKTVLAF